MKPSILVVDDDPAMVRTLCDIFTLQGWDVGAAYSGEEAIEKQRERPHGFVLMDIRMPGIDGIEAYKAIHRQSPSTRVILMTAHATPEAVQHAIDEGVWRVMPKPIDLPSLFRMLAPAA